MGGHRYIAAVSVIIFRGDEMLAMRRDPNRRTGPGLWEVVSGRVEAGEQPPRTAVRETREEAGLEIELDPRPVAVYQAKRGEEPMVVIAYRARWVSGEVVCSAEHSEHAWMTPERYAATTTLAPLARVVALAARLPWPEGRG